MPACATAVTGEGGKWKISISWQIKKSPQATYFDVEHMLVNSIDSLNNIRLFIIFQDIPTVASRGEEINFLFFIFSCQILCLTHRNGFPMNFGVEEGNGGEPHIDDAP